jgi:hypothetical protein
MNQMSLEHEGILKAIESLGLDPASTKNGMLTIKGQLVFDSDALSVSMLEVASKAGFRFVIDDYTVDKRMMLRLYFPKEWHENLLANKDLLSLAKPEGEYYFISFETWHDGERWKDDLDLRIHHNRARVNDENEKKSLEQQLKNLLPSPQ